MYYLTGVFAREYSFINCMVGRGHKSDSPNATKYAPSGKFSRETHGRNTSREQMIITARKKEVEVAEQRGWKPQYGTSLDNKLIYINCKTIISNIFLMFIATKQS